MSTPFDTLRKKYKSFRFKNITGIPQVLRMNGDSVQVPAFKSVDVPSNMVINLPSNTEFQTVIPTIKDLVEVGLIKNVTPTQETKSAAPVVEPFKPKGITIGSLSNTTKSE